MRIVYGTWGQWALRFGGISKLIPWVSDMTILMSYSFLLKDAQEDLTDTRLKK